MSLVNPLVIVCSGIKTSSTGIVNIEKRQHVAYSNCTCAMKWSASFPGSTKQKHSQCSYKMQHCEKKSQFTTPMSLLSVTASHHEYRMLSTDHLPSSFSLFCKNSSTLSLSRFSSTSNDIFHNFDSIWSSEVFPTPVSPCRIIGSPHSYLSWICSILIVKSSVRTYFSSSIAINRPSWSGMFNAREIHLSKNSRL